MSGNPSRLKKRLRSQYKVEIRMDQFTTPGVVQCDSVNADKHTLDRPKTFSRVVFGASHGLNSLPCLWLPTVAPRFTLVDLMYSTPGISCLEEPRTGRLEHRDSKALNVTPRIEHDLERTANPMPVIYHTPQNYPQSLAVLSFLAYVPYLELCLGPPCSFVKFKCFMQTVL